MFTSLETLKAHKSLQFCGSRPGAELHACQNVVLQQMEQDIMAQDIMAEDTSGRRANEEHERTNDPQSAPRRRSKTARRLSTTGRN